jgi:hypothetical protein
VLKKRGKGLKLEKKEDKIIFALIIIFSLALIFTGASVSNAQEDLSPIEEKIFHQKYTNETNEQRASRLEEFIFGRKYQNEVFETRLNRILKALQLQKEEKKLEKQAQSRLEAETITTSKKLPEDTTKSKPKVIYDESFNTGVLGAISQIELKIFNKTFNHIPFPTRVAALENQLLTKSEISKVRKQPLLERVSILVNRAGLIPSQPAQEPSINYQAPQASQKPPSQSYTLDPRTNFLIDEDTGEIIKDNFGRPVRVKIPLEFQKQNQFNPTLGFPQNPSQQQLQVPPLDFFLDQPGQGQGQEY